MAEGFNLELTQHQKLALTQEMKLSINILSMSALELRDYISNELNENFLLEESEKENVEGEFEKDNINDESIMKNVEFDSYDDGRFEKVNDNYNDLSPFQFISEQKSLKDFLREQLIESDNDELLKVCEYMIDSLDRRGYLTTSVEEISNFLGVSEKKVIDSLQLIQSLEPSGICARDLKECLEIQLKRKGIEDDMLFKLLENFLEPLSEKKYSYIAKELNISISHLQEYENIIKSLNPVPSSGFYTGEESQYIIPEAFIVKVNRDYVIIMNDRILPSLKINEGYKDIIGSESDSEASKYAKEKLLKAVSLIRSIDHRKKTLYKVLEKILELQFEYFEYGESYLKPMSLKDVAFGIEVHESTVSRAIKDKYIYTQRGLLRIKDMFTARIESEKEDVSSKAVKIKIKEIIEKEDKKKPLSDQDIAASLEQEGVYISRRTVAKYREDMKIASSSKRKVK